MARFTQRPDLTGIATAYSNAEFIADLVYPYVEVSDFSFVWDEFAQDMLFNLTDDKVGPTSRPNEVSWTVTPRTGLVFDHALDAPVPEYDKAGASGAALNPDQTAAMIVMAMIGLNREKRAADLTFTLNNYPSTQRTTLSGDSQWSAAASDPINAIRTAKDGMLMEPNMVVLGNDVWTKLSMHPKVVEAAIGTGAQYGVASLQRFAELIEIPTVLVGKARGQAALPGQAPVFSRLWGKHCALLHNNPLSRNTTGVPPTWGMTARLGQRIGGTIEDPDMGMRGGVRVRAGESVSEFIMASGCGYFFQNAVA